MATTAAEINKPWRRFWDRMSGGITPEERRDILKDMIDLVDRIQKSPWYSDEYKEAARRMRDPLIEDLEEAEAEIRAAEEIAELISAK